MELGSSHWRETLPHAILNSHHNLTYEIFSLELSLCGIFIPVTLLSWTRASLSPSKQAYGFTLCSSLFRAWLNFEALLSWYLQSKVIKLNILSIYDLSNSQMDSFRNMSSIEHRWLRGKYFIINTINNNISIVIILQVPERIQEMSVLWKHVKKRRATIATIITSGIQEGVNDFQTLSKTERNPKGQWNMS